MPLGLTLLLRVSVTEARSTRIQEDGVHVLRAIDGEDGAFWRYSMANENPRSNRPKQPPRPRWMSPDPPILKRNLLELLLHPECQGITRS